MCLGFTGPHFPSIRSLACRPLPPRCAPFSPPSSRRVHTSIPGVVCGVSPLLFCSADTDSYDHLMVYNVRSGAVNSVNISDVAKVTRLPI